MHDFGDAGPVGEGVVDAAPVPIARPRLAEVCEVESTEAVEYDIVRSKQPVWSAAIIEHRDGAGDRVDTLDPAASVVGGRAGRPQQAHFCPPLESAVVTDVECAIGTDRQ